MKIRNRTTLQFAPVAGKVNFPQPSLTLVVRGTFALRHGQAATLLPEQPGFEADVVTEAGACLYDADLALFKPRADVLLVGTCHTPGGAPATACPVKFCVGDWSRELAVIGNRTWQKGLLFSKQSQPEPFTTCAVTWANAFGGPGFADNPAGKGFKTGTLPNVEDPGRLIKSAGDKPAPASFGPVARTRKQRTRRLGTYDKAWLAERAPHFAKDFDWSYFNAAPEEQQLPGFLRGDESIVLENLHPEHPRFEARLPGLRVRAFARLGDQQGTLTMHEVPMNLDTLFVDADKGQLVLLWRGILNMRGEEAEDVADCLIFAEEPGRPATDTDIQTWLADPPEEVDAIEPLPMPDPAEEAEADAAVAAAQALFDSRLAELHARLAASVPGGFNLAALAAAPAAFTGFGPALASLKAIQPQLSGEGAAELAVILNEIESDPTLANAVTELMLAQAMAAAPAAVRLGKAGLTAALRAREQGPGGDFAGADLSGEDLSGLDFTGADFAGANLQGANLSACVLEHANFHAADLRGANLTKAKAEGCDFTSADLSAADLREGAFPAAQFFRAKMHATLLEGADLATASLAETDCTGLRAAKAKLTEADFQRAKLDGADFTEADLTALTMTGATGRAPVFTRATCVNLRAGECAFEEAVFEEAIAPDANFEEARLPGANFRYADLTRALFPGAQLAGAVFFGAVARGAMLRKADLSRAQAGNADFFEACFEKADLSNASLVTSNCYSADFWYARTDGADFKEANVKGTRLA